MVKMRRKKEKLADGFCLIFVCPEYLRAVGVISARYVCWFPDVNLLKQTLERVTEKDTAGWC